MEDNRYFPWRRKLWGWIFLWRRRGCNGEEKPSTHLSLENTKTCLSQNAKDRTSSRAEWNLHVSTTAGWRLPEILVLKLMQKNWAWMSGELALETDSRCSTFRTGCALYGIKCLPVLSKSLSCRLFLTDTVVIWLFLITFCLDCPAACCSYVNYRSLLKMSDGLPTFSYMATTDYQREEVCSICKQRLCKACICSPFYLIILVYSQILPTVTKYVSNSAFILLEKLQTMVGRICWWPKLDVNSETYVNFLNQETSLSFQNKKYMAK